MKVQGANQMKQLDLWGHRRPLGNGRYKSNPERWIGANQKLERGWPGRNCFRCEHSKLKELKSCQCDCSKECERERRLEKKSDGQGMEGCLVCMFHLRAL